MENGSSITTYKKYKIDTKKIVIWSLATSGKEDPSNHLNEQRCRCIQPVKSLKTFTDVSSIPGPTDN